MKRWILYLGILGSCASQAEQTSDDLSEVSLEKLMDIQVTGASKYTQKASEAPADVTVITAEEIHAYGWQTLADLLNSVRGFNVSSDFVYHYAGIRGYAPPGDYNTRLLVLINGHRLNDNIYDQAYIGSEFPVDLSLIRSVEISRGPGSTLYGGNALFGIVNIITKKGESIDGTQAYIKGGSGHYGAINIKHGTKLANGGDMMLSASWTDAKGRTYTFPEFIPASGTGFSGESNFLKNTRIFASYTHNGLSLMAFASERTKGNPGAMWSGLIGNTDNQTQDKQSHFEGAYTWELAKNAVATNRLFLGHYSYQATLALDGPPVYLSYDKGIGTWWGTEFKLDWKATARHRVIAGAEYQQDTKQDQTNYDTVTNLADSRSGHRAGVYVQDDWQAAETVNLIYGLRFDRAEDSSTHTSPRLAGIWKPDASITGKLMYGTAFRTANMYELHYAFPGQYVPPSSLHAETIRTLEAQIEKNTQDGGKITGSLFRYAMNHQIVLESNPALGGLQQYSNTPGTIHGKGVELEYEKKWENRLHLRSSVARYFARNSLGTTPLNSPSWMAKVNAILPPVLGWVAATEVNSLSKLKTNTGTTGSQTFINLNVTRQLTPNVEFSFLIYNLLNKNLRVPVGDDALGMGFTRDTFPAPRRGYVAKLTLQL